MPTVTSKDGTAIAYEISGDGAPPRDKWSGVGIPTLIMDGGKSPQWIRNAMKSLSAILPNARYRTLDGQTHMVVAARQAPVIKEFLAGA